MNFAVATLQGVLPPGRKRGNDPLYDIRKIKWFATERRRG